MRPARDQQIQAVIWTDELRNPRNSSPGGYQAEMHFGHSQLNGRGRSQGHSSPARERQLEATTKARPMNDGDRWHRQGRQTVKVRPNRDERTPLPRSAWSKKGFS